VIESPPTAVFDFDGTLTRRDTLMPFLRFIAGPRLFLTRLVGSTRALAGYATGLTPNHIAKEFILTKFLAGMPIGELSAMAEQFATERLPGLIDPGMDKVLSWHLRRGHRCILASASLGVYLHPWAISRGFEGMVSTALEVDTQGLITGRILGRNVFGPEKVERLQLLLGAQDLNLDFAYGDSRGDIEMLAKAKNPCYRGHFTGGTPPGWMA